MTSGTEDIEIIGVVADTKYDDIKDEVPSQVFLPRRQDDNLDALSFYVRGDIGTSALLRLIPRVVAEIDPNLPVTSLSPVREQIDDRLFFDRLVVMLSASFAGLATLVAAIGLYGVLAYNVARRTRKLGLRLALGARPRDLRWMVLKQVGAMMIVGGLIGFVGAIALGRAAAALLYGLSGTDAPTLVGAAGVLVLVFLVAGYLPARRAARMAPTEALRYE
jgi:putative ABC transport system permease protein